MSNIDSKLEKQLSDKKRLDKASENLLNEIKRISSSYIKKSDDTKKIKSLTSVLSSITSSISNRLKIIINKIKKYINKIFSVVLNENVVFDNIKKYSKVILDKLKEIIEIFLLKPLKTAFDTITKEVKKFKVIKSSLLAIIGYFGYDLIRHMNGYITLYMKPFIKKYSGIEDDAALDEFINELNGWIKAPIGEELYKYGVTKLTNSEIPATVTFLREQKYYIQKYGKSEYKKGGMKKLIRLGYIRLASQGFHSKTIHDYKKTGAKNLGFNVALHSFWNSFMGDIILNMTYGINKMSIYAIKNGKQFLKKMEFIPKKYNYKRNGKIIYKGITKRELKRIDPEMYSRMYNS